ncbi:hypothetical protein GWN26_15605 [Candidatus Saccharibacteria bacterium]|nr:hypothetical protein [Candidatus Saccharibacteria bacterium]NIV04527.1 hypothetical protein [Calditrichia bacterium]NIS39076.1 hypothetical protein [Candidatus Saccharibacteria bacterium]NIV73132.1 hypothetical protein [Calditrichia bacterium]NIW00465.1 hypothetical protein [Candidatus Saccharibacteria bacterium]
MALILILTEDPRLRTYIERNAFGNTHTFLFVKSTEEALSLLNRRGVVIKPNMDFPPPMYARHITYNTQARPVDLVISTQHISGISGARFLANVQKEHRRIRTLLIADDKLELVSGSASLTITRPNDWALDKILETAVRS